MVPTLYLPNPKITEHVCVTASIESTARKTHAQSRIQQYSSIPYPLSQFMFMCVCVCLLVRSFCVFDYICICIAHHHSDHHANKPTNHRGGCIHTHFIITDKCVATLRLASAEIGIFRFSSFTYTR